MREIIQGGGILFAIAVIVGCASSETMAQQMANEATVSSDQQGPWISNSGVAVTTGDYGTGTNTTITELFETLKYRADKGEIGVTIPYLFRNGNGVIPGESKRVRGTIPNNAHGLGDVELKGKYYWLEEQEMWPAVDLMGRVKIPTASEKRGLGTGHVDVGFGPELMKRFGSLITFESLELVLRDKPSGSAIKSTRLDYSVGVGYPFTSQFTGYASLDGGTRVDSGAKPPLEGVFSGVYKLTPSVGINGYVLVGLTSGSPDYGGGAGVTLRF